MESDAKKQATQLLKSMKKGFPAFLRAMADEIGLRIPRSKVGPFKKLCLSLAQRVLPHLIGLSKLQAPIEGSDEAKQAVEGFMKALAALHRVRPAAGDKGAGRYIRAIRAKILCPPNLMKDPDFRSIMEGQEALLGAVVRQEQLKTTTRELLAEVSKDSMPSLMTFVLGFNARIARSRSKPIKRLSPKAVVQLSDEYRDTAGLFEKRLRVAVGLNHIAQGGPQPYSSLSARDLNSLLQIVESPTNPLLHFLRGVIDRNVRNALAHGQPELIPLKESVRFKDRSRTIEWTMSEFYARTKRLTKAVVALNAMELSHALRVMEEGLRRIESSPSS